MAKLTEKQRILIDFARKNGNTISKKQACDLLPYYHNTQKHVGDVLARLVRTNIIRRIKNGMYELNLNQKFNGQSQIPFTEGLFDIRKK